jgi:hypothetical protein
MAATEQRMRDLYRALNTLIAAPRYSTMEQVGWLDMRSVIGYTHDVPEYRRELVVGMDDFVASRLLRGR